MERTLFLMRHGPAEDEIPAGRRDYDRPLTPEGRSLVKRQAERLLDKGIRFDGLIASTATRAWQTAEIIASELELTDNRCVRWPILYTARPQEVIAVRVSKSWNSVILVGHNPVLSEVASRLCKSFQGELAPGQIVGFTFPVTQWLWPDAGTLIMDLKP